MDSILVHNITDRPSVSISAKAYKVGGIVVRPGKCESIPVASLNTKSKALHGKCLWFGKLPAVYMAESKSALRAAAGTPAAMNREEVRSYLSSQPLAELKQLAASCTPALNMKPTASARLYAIRLTAACFSSAIVLDPEYFFWLGRWKKNTDGSFTEL